MMLMCMHRQSALVKLCADACWTYERQQLNMKQKIRNLTFWFQEAVTAIGDTLLVSSASASAVMLLIIFMVGAHAASCTTITSAMHRCAVAGMTRQLGEPRALGRDVNSCFNESSSEGRRAFASRLLKQRRTVCG